MDCPQGAGWVSCIALAACALPAANASAATLGLSADHSNAFFAAAAGEANNVDYARAQNGDYVFAEHNPNATLTTGGAGGACRSSSTRVVVCTEPKIAVLSFTLGDGNDFLHGAPDARTPRVVADGGPGNDTLGGGYADDLIRGGDGNDNLNPSGTGFAGATDGDDRVLGGNGNDTLRGFDGDDLLVGEDGIDDLSGGNGNDVVGGGPGDDVVVGGGPGNDTLNGGPGNDDIQGNTGDDLFAAGGASVGGGTIPDGSGADSFSGGPGRDEVLYGGTEPLVITMDGAPNDGQTKGAEKDNVRADVEDLQTGDGADVITGNALDNHIQSGAGDDRVQGGDGNDWLDGDAGNDTLDGGDGIDTLESGDGDDLLLGQGGADSADGGGGMDTVEGGAGPDSVTGGVGADTVRGGDGNDSVLGAAPGLVGGADAGDELDGGAGDDVLDGGAGKDSLDGGPGADELHGDADEDTADYHRRTAGVVVSLDSLANDGEPGEADNVASDVERVVGGGAGDTLIGDGTANALNGGPGEDYIDGGPGADVISGGARGDVIRSRGGDADRVSCGAGADFVIADAGTAIDTDCDPTRVDRGDRPPQIGRSTLVAPLAGTVTMSPAGIQREVPLEDTVLLPATSLLNAALGTVRLTGATPPGGTQTGEFRGSAFSISQTRGGRPITRVTLAGGGLARCPHGRASASAKPPKRRLFGHATGRFRTRGRHSSATVRGTTWITEDRCDGTLTIVRQGAVVVRDFRLRKNVTVKAGHRYLARRARR